MQNSSSYLFPRFRLKKTHFEKLARRNCTEFLREIYLQTCDQRNQPTNQQNPEVEKLSRTMQNLSRLRELINGGDTWKWAFAIF